MIDILVLEHDDEVASILFGIFRDAGFHCEIARSSGRPIEELAKVIEGYDPRVIMYDMGPPPYRWAFDKWNLLSDRPECQGRKFIITTTEPHANLRIAPHKQPIVGHVIIKPSSLDDLVSAVRTSLT